MPTYDYQCQKCGFEFERTQRITEDAIKTCPECKSRKAKRLLSAPNFILKGGGWYADGYGSSGGGDKPSKDSTGGDDSSDSSSNSDSKKDKKDKKSSDGKSKSSSADGSASGSSRGKSGGGKAKKSAA